MPEVFAGIVCGYAVALALTPVGALAIVRARVTNPLFDQSRQEGARLVVTSMSLHVLAFVVFSAIGLVLGLLLHGIESNRPDGGLGSPNRVFTLLVLAIAAIAVLPLAAVAPRLRAPLLVAGVLFAGIFGWAMPHLAALA